MHGAGWDRSSKRIKRVSCHSRPAPEGDICQTGCPWTLSLPRRLRQYTTLLANKLGRTTKASRFVSRVPNIIVRVHERLRAGGVGRSEAPRWVRVRDRRYSPSATSRGSESRRRWVGTGIQLSQPATTTGVCRRQGALCCRRRRGALRRVAGRDRPPPSRTARMDGRRADPTSGSVLSLRTSIR